VLSSHRIRKNDTFWDSPYYLSVDAVNVTTMYSEVPVILQ
jgi:hypothetical protein